LMYCQSFLVTSVRGIAFAPTTAASLSSGRMGFMNAALGLRFDFFFFAARRTLRFAALRFVAIRTSINGEW
jgi:hypothetical protein